MRPDEPERSGASVIMPPVDIMSLLADNAGPIVGGLIGSVATLVGVLITRGTMRGSSRKQRTDEYRREVRSAASSVVSAAHTFIDAAIVLERSVFLVKDTVRTPSGHDQRYYAYQHARVELEEKIADFEFLVDIDMLSKAARAITVHALLTDLSIPEIIDESKFSHYTEATLGDDLKAIRMHTDSLKKTILPAFRESVIKYVPHTIVEERRRRKRIFRLFTIFWTWLVKQHRKNLSHTPPKQTPPTRTGPPPVPQSIAPTTKDHAIT